jgi:monoamine oxidase
VAICRLKRVAADERDADITSRLPKIPRLKNGKRIACIGAGSASLTVANDLMPLGYEVTIFEQYGEPGGLMRTNIPSFRLPHEVLNDEIQQILGMGVELKLNHPIKSLRTAADAGIRRRAHLVRARRALGRPRETSAGVQGGAASERSHGARADPRRQRAQDPAGEDRVLTGRELGKRVDLPG